jgi:serine/threonine protein kinase
MRNRTPGDPFAPEPPKEALRDAAGVGYLGDRYRILRVLRGGMGEVYICETLGVDPNRVALKTFQKRLFFASGNRHAFIREATLWMRLTGEPHVLPAIGIEEFDDRPFVLMPAIEAAPGVPTTVRGALAHVQLNVRGILTIALQTTIGMSRADARIPGIVHGDLKPENLLLLEKGVHVADFGLSRVTSQPDPLFKLDGTWAYQAPECFPVGRISTRSSDVYSFGVLLYEMLHGKRPFQAFTREEWAELHATVTPEPLGAPQPAERPVSFSQLFEELSEIANQWDPVATFQIIYDSATLKHSADEMRRNLRPSLVRSLLKLDEPKLAVEELERIPEAEFDAKLWVLKGTALSLTDRDEEALKAYETALDAELTGESRHHCLSELALSLKRLGNFDKAIEIYEQLIVDVSEETLPQIVTGLATVYITSERFDDAVRTLEGFVRKNPDIPKAWANLGIAHQMLEHPEEAMRAYDSALGLSPGLGEIMVRRAEILMDYYARVPEAALSLDMAFDQGYESRAWFVRTLACARLLGNVKDAETLVKAGRRNIGADIVEKMEREAELVVERVKMLKVAGGSPPVTDDSPTPVKGAEAGSMASVPEDTDATPSSAASVFRTPFLNFRFYAQDGTFSIDFYDDPESAGFIDRFTEAWRRSTRDPRLGHSRLRTTPLYFTTCPKCSQHVLTNRDRGKRLNCRRCDESHETSAMKSANLLALLSKVTDAIGKTLVSTTGRMQVVVFQPTSGDQAEILAECCRRAGFEALPQDNSLVLNLLAEGTKRRLFELGERVIGWAKRCGEARKEYVDETPQEVEALLRSIHETGAGPIRSMSFSYNPESDDPITLSYQGRIGDIEQRMRDDLARSPHDPTHLAGLVEILLAGGKLDEAFDKAVALKTMRPEDAKAWAAVGRIELRRGNMSQARDALEHSLRIDPVDQNMMFLLAHCYESLGDMKRAAYWAARSRSLGGPAP